MKTKLINLFCVVGFCLLPLTVFASSSNGTIDITNRYTWTENVGWLDFGTDGGNVGVIDTALTGYAWGENIGWVSLNCANTDSCTAVSYKVSNDTEGNLSGYAWSENAGWIQFDPVGGGVTIDSSGDFSGYAWGENVGWISFNCTDTNSCGDVSYKVSTDWRPVSVRNANNTTTTNPVRRGHIAPIILHLPITPPQTLSNPVSVTPPVTPLTILPNPVQNTSTKIIKPVTARLTKNFSKNNSNPQIKVLQQFLNANGFIVAAKGPGSPGHETNNFGSATKKALIAFQNFYADYILKPAKLKQGTGILGDLTRAFINNFLAKK